MALVDRLQDEAVTIYLLHGVVSESRHRVRNYTHKHICAAQFDQLLADLLNAGSPVSMADIVDATLSHRTLPSRAFAMTFDDGFENNYSVAAPILKRYGVPATFYVTTNFIDHNQLSWIDEIEYAVENVDVVCSAQPFATATDTFRTVEEKQELLDGIRRYVKGHPSLDPYAFAEEFRRGLGVGPPIPDPSLDQKLTWDQIRELQRDSLFTIGGHGVTHRILTHLDVAELESEVRTSIERLHRETNHVPVLYSYPEGLAHCYSDEVIKCLKENGILSCPTAEDGINVVGDDLFRLKRIMVT